MNYMENTYVCLAAPLLLAVLCLRREGRRSLLFTLSGMTACLCSAYISTYLAALKGIDAAAASYEIVPVVEEIMKSLPVLFFLLVYEPEKRTAIAGALMVAVGFATFENVCFLTAYGSSDLLRLVIRGFGTGAMHVVCGMIVAIGIFYLWEQAWLRIVGAFALLCFVITYHAVFNIFVSRAGAVFWVGSVIGAMGPRQQVADFAQNQFLRMSSRLKHLGDLFNPSRAGISEAVVPPTSNVIGKSAADLRLRKERGISLLAINRDKQVIREDVRDVQLRAGDMLVFHSIWTDLAQAARSRDFVVVTDYPTGEQRPHKFKIAMAIFALTILIALTSKLPVALTLMTGVAGMLLTGVLRMDEAYASINWKTVFMMAGLIPLGWAMDSSGAAAWVAGHTIDKLPTGIPVWVLEVALALLTTAFSLVISHVGATIVMVPIAVNLALAAGGNPTAFALIVALSASNNLMTASNPVISMITGPANYTPREMWRVGGPLSLIYTCVVVLMINLMF